MLVWTGSPPYFSEGYFTFSIIRCEKREIKYLTKDEWDKLRALIDKSRDRMIIELLYETGMRVGELAKTQVEDIDFSGGYIRIPWENT